ncbi:50S ribosomal protein L3 [Dehalogenimonas etheniformans]|uniref:Large ribosomal subunit protein uL3 n=1 Tax=Dehalogenimonas etheniformans TaxID=1536648 RepID=A0A2P5P7I8_9CHLR|nr:50S ribosomal protein L3 [Dehalogenimonas etheniformans]PPD58256.1 50S ribosomal protein L3 [Dehalogenimonas etheniformans]QNT75665.1 50S ribosomal protein L3 [Dehalogenimonas etheniformans]
MMNGIIGKKLGMTQVYGEGGKAEPVTVLAVGPCTVTMLKTVEKDGYAAAQLGFGTAKKLAKAEKGHTKDLGEFRHLREFRLEDTAGIEVGAKIDAGLFADGELIDVTGTSKGKGFAGGVKRHGFHGGAKTHGQSDRHRAPGSIGSTTTPGRVYPGTRMAGHMGHEQVTVRSLKVVKADKEKNLLLVRGAVPGAKNGLILIKKSKKSK